MNWKELMCRKTKQPTNLIASQGYNMIYIDLSLLFFVYSQGWKEC